MLFVFKVHCLPCQHYPDKFTKWQNASTLCFLSVLVQMLFSEEPLLVDLLSDSFSFAIFSFSCKYSISDFCETIKVSKLDKDGRWDTYFQKVYMQIYMHLCILFLMCKYLHIILLHYINNKYSEKENFISVINCKLALAKLSP